MEPSRANIWVGISGWYGVVAVVGAYALVSFGLLSAESVLYQALNITGSLGIVAVAVSKKDTQSAVLNVVWAIIGLVAFARIFI